MWVLQVKLETINEYNKFVQHLNLGKEFDYSLILDMINLINISEASNQRFVDSVDEIEKQICSIAKLIKNINDDLEGVHNDINDLQYSIEIIGEILHKLYIDLTQPELSEIIQCDDCEYDGSKWVFKSNVDILLPYKADYIIDLTDIVGDGTIFINGLSYDMAAHLKVHLSSVELIDISSLDNFSISSIRLIGGIRLVTKLSELENDIIDIEDDTLIIIK